MAQGTVLVELDPALASAELATARAEERRLEAELAQARRTVERVGRFEAGVLAASEVEQAATQVSMLQAQVEGAQANVRLAGARLARHRVKRGTRPRPRQPPQRAAHHPDADAAPRPRGRCALGDDDPGALPGPVTAVFEERLRQSMPLRAERILRRIRALRGGGLNDPRFGNRMRGRGAQWHATEQLFRMWHRRLGYDSGHPPRMVGGFRRPTGQLDLFAASRAT